MPPVPVRYGSALPGACISDPGGCAACSETASLITAVTQWSLKMRLRLLTCLSLPRLPLFERSLAPGFAFPYVGGHYGWKRRRIRVGCRRVGARVLGRVVREELVCILAAASQAGRVLHCLAVLGRVPGKAGLLPAGCFRSPDLVLVLSAHYRFNASLGLLAWKLISSLRPQAPAPRVQLGVRVRLPGPHDRVAPAGAADL